MENQPLVVRIPALTELEKLELEKQVNPNLLEFKKQTIETDAHGELMTTTAVVIITVAALQGLTAWLLRTSRRRKIKKVFKITYPDGRTEERTIELDLSESQAPEADVLEAIAALFKVDPDLLASS